MNLLHIKIKYKKSVIFILVVLILIIIMSILVVRLEQPQSVQAVFGKSITSQSGFNVNLTPTAYKDSFVAFNYPKGLSKKHSNPLAATDVDIINFSAQDILSWTLAIDITNTGSKPLNDDSSYRIRIEQPSIYKQSSLYIGNQNVTVMTDTSVSSFSKVAFLQHNNLRATVSLIGDDAQGSIPLQTTWNMILSSWRWQ